MSINGTDRGDRIRACLGDSRREETAVMAELREETKLFPQSSTQISPDQARFMFLIVASLKPVKAIEPGMFTGMSALVSALALPGKR